MGHTSRSLAIIRAFLTQNYEVVFAGTEEQQKFVASSIRGITTDYLPGLNLRYSKTSVVTSILTQSPKFLSLFQSNPKYCKKLTETHKPTLIISDENPYFSTPEVRSIYISHQLNIQAPFSTVVNKMHHQILTQADEIWCPDNPAHMLSGRLGTPLTPFSKPIRFIGWLSHVSPTKRQIKHDALLILTGPEPMRTQFAKEALEMIDASPLQKVGVVGSSEPILHKKIKAYGVVSSTVLTSLFHGTNIILSRSGYSTLMDCALHEKTAYLTPTPGQHEQEYLFNHGLEHGWFAPFEEIKNSLLCKSEFPYVSPDENASLLHDAIQRLA